MNTRFSLSYVGFFLLSVVISSDGTEQSQGSLSRSLTSLSMSRVDDLIKRMTLEQKASQLVNQARAIPRLAGACLRLVERGAARSRQCGNSDGFSRADWTGGNI